MTDWTTRDMADLKFHVRTRGQQSLEFEVRDIVGGETDGTLYFHASEYEGSNNLTSVVEQAELFASGFIRFDGCANVNWHGDRGMMHGCGREDMTRLGPLFDRLYDLAIEAMPEHAHYLGRRVENSKESTE